VRRLERAEKPFVLRNGKTLKDLTNRLTGGERFFGQALPITEA
jgi:hypothetical protein